MTIFSKILLYVILVNLLGLLSGEKQKEVIWENGGYNYHQVFLPFGSLHTMQSLSYWSTKEEEIYTDLKLRRGNILQEIDLISKFLNGYEKTTKKAFEETKAPVKTVRDRGRLIGGNPILAHRMTNRYSFEVDELRKLMNSTEYFIIWRKYIHVLGLEENVRKATESSDENKSFQVNWPNHYDLLVSLVANLEIQSFYNLKSETVFHGATFDTKFGGVLDSSDCTLLGVMALRLGYYYLALDWIELSKQLGLGIWNNNQDLVKSLYQVAVQLHNNKYKSDKTSQLSELHLLVDPLTSGSASPRIPFRKYAIKLYGRKYGNYTLNYLNMYSICNGDEFQPKSIKYQLHCFLEKQRHPYFVLNHLKTEELSRSPYIVQFYDVLGNKTIENVYKSRGTANLATTYGLRYVESVAYRSCSGSVLDYEFMYKIQNKSELLTGLRLTDNIERLQATEYTYGRFFKMHTDPFSKPIKSVIPVDPNNEPTIEQYGDRLATLLYYVDVPKQGGSTAFTEVGISPNLVRGSAVFWLNMFRNGSVRADVTHVACPVIHGYKTIINQWIRYNINFHNFQCGISQLD